MTDNEREQMIEDEDRFQMLNDIADDERFSDDDDDDYGPGCSHDSDHNYSGDCFSWQSW